MERGFKPQLKAVLFGRFAYDLLEKFGQVFGRIVGYFRQRSAGQVLVGMLEDMVDDLGDPCSRVGGIVIFAHGSRLTTRKITNSQWSIAYRKTFLDMLHPLPSLRYTT